MQTEGRIAGTLGGGEHHREVLGATSGHDGVDGGFLDAESAVVRRQLAEQFVARSSGSGEHPLEPLAGRRHDGQPVGHAFVEPDFEFVGGGHGARCYPVAQVSDNSRTCG